MSNLIDMRNRPDLLAEGSTWVVDSNREPVFKNGATYWWVQCSVHKTEETCMRYDHLCNSFGCTSCLKEKLSKMYIHDLRRKTIGNWLVLDEPHKRTRGRTWWHVKCLVHGTLEWRQAGSLTAERGKGSRGCHKCGGLQKRKLPFEWLYNILKKKATESGRQEVMTYEEFLGFTKALFCHYCGNRLAWVPWNPKRGKPGHGYNLDRMDNSKDYPKTNCVPCCGRCNLIRGDNLSYAEMVEVGKLLRTMREGGTYTQTSPVSIMVNIPQTIAVST